MPHDLFPPLKKEIRSCLEFHLFLRFWTASTQPSSSTVIFMPLMFPSRSLYVNIYDDFNNQQISFFPSFQFSRLGFLSLKKFTYYYRLTMRDIEEGIIRRWCHKRNGLPIDNTIEERNEALKICVDRNRWKERRKAKGTHYYFSPVSFSLEISPFLACFSTSTVSAINS